MSTHFVLRCVQTGDAYAAQDERPEGFEAPVLWGDRLCYWGEEERRSSPAPIYGVCRECGADSVRGYCTYDLKHRA